MRTANSQRQQHAQPDTRRNAQPQRRADDECHHPQALHQVARMVAGPPALQQATHPTVGQAHAQCQHHAGQHRQWQQRQHRASQHVQQAQRRRSGQHGHAPAPAGLQRGQGPRARSLKRYAAEQTADHVAAAQGQEFAPGRADCKAGAERSAGAVRMPSAAAGSGNGGAGSGGNGSGGGAARCRKA